MIVLALLLAAGTGALSGKVTLSGLAPKLAPLPVTRDMKVCGNNKPDESVEVSQGGGVRNAVVWLIDVPVPKEVKARKETLDQQHCAFVPHVVVAPVGSTVDVINSDKALHNVRAQAGDVKLMNYAMPIPGHVVPTKLQKDGMFKVSCDVHPWMRAWLVVLPTAAFAVTGEDGRYGIADLPPGRHRIKIWHERLGEREAEVQIRADETTTYDLQYNPR